MIFDNQSFPFDILYYRAVTYDPPDRVCPFDFYPVIGESVV